MAIPIPSYGNRESQNLLSLSLILFDVDKVRENFNAINSESLMMSWDVDHDFDASGQATISAITFAHMVAYGFVNTTPVSNN